jgi:hypothetical protein
VEWSIFLERERGGGLFAIIAGLLFGVHPDLQALAKKRSFFLHSILNSSFGPHQPIELESPSFSERSSLMHSERRTYFATLRTGNIVSPKRSHVFQGETGFQSYNIGMFTFFCIF